MVVDSDAVQMLTFAENLREWSKTAFVERRKLLTRKGMATGLPPRRLKDSDFDDEPFGGTAYRTARNPAFE